MSDYIVHILAIFYRLALDAICVNALAQVRHNLYSSPIRPQPLAHHDDCLGIDRRDTGEFVERARAGVHYVVMAAARKYVKLI